MYFDAHSDILYDIVSNKVQGTKVLENHLLDLTSFQGGIWAYWNGENEEYNINEAINIILDELNHPKINIIKDSFIDNKFNILLGFEGLTFLKSLEQLEYLNSLGFKHAMLTWNIENHLAGGSLTDNSKGLTPFGKKVIKKMIELNMIIDVSHSNKKTFYDIIDIANRKIMASHSNAYSLSSHHRNLDDEQIKLIGEKNGLICLTTIGDFLRTNTIDELINHIKYVINLTSIDNVGLGFDFVDYLNDYNKNLVDLPSSKAIDNLTTKLKEHFTQEEIDKITHKNVINFIKGYI